MSFALFVMMMSLGSSVVIAFVLHPAGEDPPTSANSPDTRHIRCQAESVLSIRRGLLRALNFKTEPQLPVGGLDGIKDQWKSTFSTIVHSAKDNAVPALSVAPAVGNDTSLKCCTRTAEISMRDLGWDNWVIAPDSFTIVKCASCNPDNTLHCPSFPTYVKETHSQVPCCQPTSYETVPILYLAEGDVVTYSTMQLSRSCGCGLGNHQLPGEE